MKFEDFDKLIKGIDRISERKIRDSWSPIPRGYNLYGRDGYILLISADASINLYFDQYSGMFENKVVSLHYKGVEIGAINIQDMEVVE